MHIRSGTAVCFANCELRAQWLPLIFRLGEQTLKNGRAPPLNSKHQGEARERPGRTRYRENTHAMVSIKNILIGAAVLPCALASSIFAREEQNPLKMSLLPGEQPVPGDSPVAVCDIYEKQLFKLEAVNLDPNPPVRGDNITIDATAYLSVLVEEGAYVEVDVKYGYIKLISQTYDLCDQVGEVDLECPLQPGEYKLSKTVAIPAEVPPGKYTVYARAFTKDDAYLACVTATVVFSADGAWKILNLNG